MPSRVRHRNRQNASGFSLIELVIVVAVLAILAAISLPFFQQLIEDAEASGAQVLLVAAHKECKVKLASGEVDTTYVIPPNTNYFQFPDLGADGKCLSPASRNILTADQTAYGKLVSSDNLNINVVTEEKSTDRNVPSHIIWQ